MISVIIPVYNTEKYIANTINSILAQTYHDYEIVLVDDESLDDSIPVAEHLLQRKGISYQVVHQKNQGQWKARNAGVSLAAGDWIYFLDSDDAIQPFTFELLVNATERYPAADIVYTKFQNVMLNEIMKQSLVTEKMKSYSRDNMLRGFLLRNKIVLVPGTLYRSDFLKHNNIMHVGIRWSEDQHFIWQVLNKIRIAVFVECVTYNYLTRPGSTMHTISEPIILDAHREFKAMVETLDCDSIKKLIVPRWTVGTLHAAAKVCSQAKWDMLYRNLNSYHALKSLLFFPDVKIKMMAAIGLISQRMLYRILRLK